jgi:hypothetical protein
MFRFCHYLPWCQLSASSAQLTQWQVAWNDCPGGNVTIWISS